MTRCDMFYSIFVERNTDVKKNFLRWREPLIEWVKNVEKSTQRNELIDVIRDCVFYLDAMNLCPTQLCQYVTIVTHLVNIIIQHLNAYMIKK